MPVHEFAPIYDDKSKILILGSFPSVKSRETGFYYGNPQNRFWALLAFLLQREKPEEIFEKKQFLSENHIALFDVIASCEITGSSDSSIRNAVPNDLTPIFQAAPIEKICTNGKTAEKLYRKYLFPKTGRNSICLPSTSPANAGCSFEKLCEEWKIIL